MAQEINLNPKSPLIKSWDTQEQTASASGKLKHYNACWALSWCTESAKPMLRHQTIVSSERRYSPAGCKDLVSVCFQHVCLPISLRGLPRIYEDEEGGGGAN